MKTKSFYLALALLSFISWSCTNQNDLSQSSLKSSINSSVQDLTTAMTVISSSEGYKVLAVSNSESGPSLVKSSSETAIAAQLDTILLSDITGVYDYKATRYKRGMVSVLRYFTKTAEDAQMIVRLPEEKVKNPKALLMYVPSDTLLTNNYVIALNDYNYISSYLYNYHVWDYSMGAKITVKDVEAGALKIQSSNSVANGYKYASDFVFTNNYAAKCNYASGDTAVATYAIIDGAKTLYEEKYTAIKTAAIKRHREKEYALTIGDVQIIRKQGPNSLDSAKVYVAGVLQLNSKVEMVIDSTSTDATDNSIINKKRDLKITFDDGTSSTITELLGTSLDTIRTLFKSLRQASFATSIVDWVAWDIYKNK